MKKYILLFLIPLYAFSSESLYRNAFNFYLKKFSLKMDASYQMMLRSDVADFADRLKANSNLRNILSNHKTIYAQGDVFITRYAGITRHISPNFQCHIGGISIYDNHELLESHSIEDLEDICSELTSFTHAGSPDEMNLPVKMELKIDEDNQKFVFVELKYYLKNNPFKENQIESNFNIKAIYNVNEGNLAEEKEATDPTYICEDIIIQQSILVNHSPWGIHYLPTTCQKFTLDELIESQNP